MKYKIKEITPKDMMCVAGTCPAIYEVTPKDMVCIIGACPAIYEVTPKDMACVAYACPSIHDFKDDYLIIGKKVDDKEFGLEKKIGDNEVLISVPKRLIDDMEK